ncbi:MAG: hypothetical protein DI606_03125 [Sphingobium sp.]|uniref:hypothetical protein n=1 Tax=Sphingobium sp. TaxID=1912891 RepID=UPI000DB838D0|nr:hypothetical protein [Sphingobium sp.]PZU14239.1 MAG: hypothetical protein DI606_03125 [Sphingobium sp.]
MSEPKPLASLTSGLLARKGAAQPAMRRPTIGFGRPAAMPQDDLGWNDMGFDVESAPHPVEESASPIGLTPITPLAVEPPVVVQRKSLARRLAAGGIAPDAAPAKGRKAAFTLRLDTERHLKLRLACAVSGRSAQQVVTQALDDFLSDQPEIDRLAEQLPRVRGGKV